MSTEHLSAWDKAGVLLETLPWLREYSGSRIVIKYGGNAMISEELKAAFAQDVSFLHEWGIEPVVVHGGGPQINSMLKTLGIAAPFVSGLRVTSPEVMKVVRMVLTGTVQRELVSLLNESSIAATGFFPVLRTSARSLRPLRRIPEAIPQALNPGTLVTPWRLLSFFTGQLQSG